MTALPYPSHIRPLTSLRFIAAIWVLLYHFREHLGFDLSRIGLVANGYLGVDLFFTLSGFILAHVYLGQIERGGFGYGGFLKNRIARIYPMHLAALAAMLALYAGASALGIGVGAPEAFKLADLPQHLMLIHAWGATQSVGWNFPSWSISAEWGAYLLFPLIGALVLKTKRAGVMLAAALTLCLGSFVALDHLHTRLAWVGQDFSQMTAQIGALRILPSFLLGIALYAFGAKRQAPVWAAWPIALASAFWIIAVATLQLWAGLTWLGLAGLIYGLSETARHGRDKAVAGERFVFLGGASYSLYMIHLPIDIVWFHGLRSLGVDAGSSVVLRAAALIGVFVVCVFASTLAYLWIEEPARKWIRRQELAKLSPSPAPQL